MKDLSNRPITFTFNCDPIDINCLRKHVEVIDLGEIENMSVDEAIFINKLKSNKCKNDMEE